MIQLNVIVWRQTRLRRSWGIHNLSISILSIAQRENESGREREREKYLLGQLLILAFFKLHAVGSWSSLASWIPRFLICSLPLRVCKIKKHKHSGFLSLISEIEVQQSFVGVASFAVTKFRHFTTLSKSSLHLVAKSAARTLQTNPQKNKTRKNRKRLVRRAFILFFFLGST